MVQAVPTDLAGVLVLEPKVFGDERGYFMETYNRGEFRRATGFDVDFVQDNHSHSGRGVLRGLHYQLDPPQGKLVWVTAGAVFDVAVDLRRHSPGFGSWTGVELSSENHRQVWIPPGFAHGFYVIADWADVNYKTTEFYSQTGDRSLRWDDPTIAVKWPLEGAPSLSIKDRNAPLLDQADLYD